MTPVWSDYFNIVSSTGKFRENEAFAYVIVVRASANESVGGKAGIHFKYLAQFAAGGVLCAWRLRGKRRRRTRFCLYHQRGICACDQVMIRTILLLG